MYRRPAFPQKEAAEVARESVLDYFAQHPDFHVVFNVFKEEDERIYHELFY